MIRTFFYIPFFVVILYLIPAYIYSINEKEFRKVDEKDEKYLLCFHQKRIKNKQFTFYYFGIILGIETLCVVLAFIFSMPNVFMILLKSGVLYLFGLILALAVYIIGKSNKKINIVSFEKVFFQKIFIFIACATYVLVYLLNYIPVVSRDYVLSIYSLDLYVAWGILSLIAKGNPVIVISIMAVTLVGIPTIILLVGEIIKEKKLKAGQITIDNLYKTQSNFFKKYYIILCIISFFSFCLLWLETLKFKIAIFSVMVCFNGVILQLIAFLIFQLILARKKAKPNFSNICLKACTLFYKWIIPVIFIISIVLSVIFNNLFHV